MPLQHNQMQLSTFQFHCCSCFLWGTTKQIFLIIHFLGPSFIAGRIAHAKGMLSANLKLRVLGMQITIYTIIGLALINFVYRPFAQLFKL